MYPMEKCVFRQNTADESEITVTSPISSDKTLAPSPDQNLRTRARTSESEARPNRPEAAESVPRDVAEQPPSVNFDRASRLYNADNATQRASESPIQSQEQALGLLERIKSQMAADPSNALAAFGNVDAQQAATLMQQA